MTNYFQHTFPNRNCRAYSGEEGLVTLLSRDDVDAVIMSLPINVQPAYVLRILKAGKHVLSEKPTAGTTKEGLETIATYRETFFSKGLVWNVAENSRYDKLYTETAKTVRETIGPPKTLDFQVQMTMEPSSGWLKTQWRRDSSWGDLGFFIDGVVHFVSGFRLIAPSPPVAVSANLTSKLDYMPGYDTLVAQVEFEDGSSGLFEASYVEEGARDMKIHVTDAENKTVVTQGMVVITDAMNVTKNVKWGGFGKVKVFLSFARDCQKASQLMAEFGNIGLDDNITPEQSLLDVSFLEACLESSLAEGKRVAIRTATRI